MNTPDPRCEDGVLVDLEEYREKTRPAAVIAFPAPVSAGL
jgi:hypothetical protein